MYRKEVPHSYNNISFRNAAIGTKAVNLGVITYRGGIRF